GVRDLEGPIGAQHDQRQPALARLDHRGVVVGERRARGADEHARHAREPRLPEREEARAALVDQAVAVEPARLAGGPHERRRARAGADDGGAHAGLDQALEQDRRPLRLRIRHSRSSALGVSAAPAATTAWSSASTWSRRTRARPSTLAPGRRPRTATLAPSAPAPSATPRGNRSEEHTSELQSRENLV